MGSIQFYVTPDTLFRFRNIGHNSNNSKTLNQELDAVAEGYLWGASFDQMNDPMEGFFEVNAIGQEPARVQEVVNNIINNNSAIGLCCLSETVKNELMWGTLCRQILWNLCSLRFYGSSEWFC